MTSTISAPTTGAKFEEAVCRLAYIVEQRHPIAFVSSPGPSSAARLVMELRNRCRQPFRVFVGVSHDVTGSAAAPLEERMLGNHLAGLHTVVLDDAGVLTRRSRIAGRLFDFACEHPQSATIITFGPPALLARPADKWRRTSPVLIEMDGRGWSVS